MTGDGFWRFPQCMSYPPPFSLLYFIFYGYVRVHFPECSVGYFVCPLQVLDSAQAFVGEGLY